MEGRNGTTRQTRTKKRQEILDAAERFVFTKGYEQMSIQNILDEVKNSITTSPRAALLSAFIERIKQEMEKPLLLPILRRLVKSSCPCCRVWAIPMPGYCSR